MTFGMTHHVEVTVNDETGEAVWECSTCGEWAPHDGPTAVEDCESDANDHRRIGDPGVWRSAS